jgi:hypothetical protein
MFPQSIIYRRQAPGRLGTRRAMLLSAALFSVALLSYAILTLAR